MFMHTPISQCWIHLNTLCGTFGFVRDLSRFICSYLIITIRWKYLYALLYISLTTELIWLIAWVFKSIRYCRLWGFRSTPVSVEVFLPVTQFRRTTVKYSGWLAASMGNISPRVLFYFASFFWILLVGNAPLVGHSIPSICNYLHFALVSTDLHCLDHARLCPFVFLPHFFSLDRPYFYMHQGLMNIYIYILI